MYMNVVFVSFQLFNQPLVVGRHGSYGFLDFGFNIEVLEYFPAVLGTEDQMVVNGIPSVSARAITFLHVPSVYHGWW